ncbi:MAG: pseudouridine synthase, partial [Prevotella sp.]|nr:pseudouridine synthase [Prevotella sp.]
MSEEFESKSEEVQAGNNSQENSREGYRPVSGNTGYRTGRSPRPRIHAQRAYVPRRTGDDQE